MEGSFHPSSVASTFARHACILQLLLQTGDSGGTVAMPRCGTRRQRKCGGPQSVRDWQTGDRHRRGMERWRYRAWRNERRSDACGKAAWDSPLCSRPAQALSGRRWRANAVLTQCHSGQNSYHRPFIVSWRFLPAFPPPRHQDAKTTDGATLGAFVSWWCHSQQASLREAASPRRATG